ncbi:MAG TPA: STAS/SEC14 domain-containing protein [Sphingopyxis sp.]|nr:STAS/SEC14 domain-containing protein [Sphingopyxis sp.]
MFEMIDTKDDVLAVRIHGKITGKELAEIMDRLDAAMATNEKVHVYVETRSIDGIEIAGLGAHLARAAPLMRKLDQFGRVAVVADQLWIRALTRIESALLPHISYRVFETEDRGAALMWVEGNAG